MVLNFILWAIANVMLLCRWSSTSIIEAFSGRHPTVVDVDDVVVVVDGPSTMKDVGLTVY